MTRRIAVLGLTVTLVAMAGVARANEAEVRAAHAARVAATIKGDLPTLAGLLTDDMTYTHGSAKLETKQEFVDLIRTGYYQYKAIVTKDVTVRVYGDAALLSGIAEPDVITNGQPAQPKLRFTEVWVKRSGKWQLASWQSTRIAPPTP
ncbi:MAG TPA: nuclear transport factor 2 family protein [Vicinamibacteria bacterium]